MRGRPKAELVLSAAERAELDSLALRRKTAQALALRARVVLACASGIENKQVAARLNVTHQTVGKWRSRFIVHRLDGLLDAPRPGAPRTIEDSHVSAIIAKTLESVPRNATQWSTRSMAREMGMSQTAISRIWRAFGLQPHRQETFKLSTDPMFVDKVRDIVGLYLDPPVKAMVLCVDEKSQIQALDRTQPQLPLAPGLPARRTHDYVWHGTTTLFAAPQSGVSRLPQGHRSQRADRPGHSSGDGQLRHPQEPDHQGLVRTAATISCALHAYLGLLDQPGRTMVRNDHPELHSSRHAPIDTPTRERNSRLHQGQQRKSEAFCMDQVR